MPLTDQDIALDHPIIDAPDAIPSKPRDVVASEPFEMHSQILPTDPVPVGTLPPQLTALLGDLNLGGNKPIILLVIGLFTVWIIMEHHIDSLTDHNVKILQRQDSLDHAQQSLANQTTQFQNQIAGQVSQVQNKESSDSTALKASVDQINTKVDTKIADALGTLRKYDARLRKLEQALPIAPMPDTKLLVVPKTPPVGAENILANMSLPKPCDAVRVDKDQDGWDVPYAGKMDKVIPLRYESTGIYVYSLSKQAFFLIFKGKTGECTWRRAN